MNLDILTREDLKIFKTELLEEIRRMIQPPTENKEWLKSSDLMKLLNCSPGTLQNLRINGTFPFPLSDFIQLKYQTLIPYVCTNILFQ
jgi:hypothetical protein